MTHKKLKKCKMVPKQKIQEEKISPFFNLFRIYISNKSCPPTKKNILEKMPHYDEVKSLVIEKNIDLIVFDPFILLFEGLDENSAHDVSSAMKLLTEIGVQTQPWSLWIIRQNNLSALITRMTSTHVKVPRRVPSIK